MSQALSPSQHETSPGVTQLLRAWSAGDQSALTDLIPLVMDELRRIARRHMRSEPARHLLQTTALINEAYVRLSPLTGQQWHDRTHFLAMASRLMRRILVDFARADGSLKRGAGFVSVTFDDNIAASSAAPDLMALDDALIALAKSHPRASRVVELRFFWGFTVEETARYLRVSPETVMRDWSLAKSWLVRQVHGLS